MPGVSQDVAGPDFRPVSSRAHAGAYILPAPTMHVYGAVVIRHRVGRRSCHSQPRPWARCSGITAAVAWCCSRAGVSGAARALCCTAGSTMAQVLDDSRRVCAGSRPWEPLEPGTARPELAPWSRASPITAARPLARGL